MPASTSHQASAAARLSELSLPGRVHIGLAAPEPVARLRSELDPVDAVLGGGVPRGRISEFLGPLSSGKTSLLLALLAAATRRGEVVACVDLADALHPESVVGAGADLHRLLWVRPRAMADGLRCTELLLQAGGFALIVFDLGTPLPRPLRRHVWPRLLHAAEQSHTALVMLAPRRVAGSFAALSLGLRPRALQWQGGVWRLFEGLDAEIVVERSKLGMPGRSVRLHAISGAPASRRQMVFGLERTGRRDAGAPKEQHV